MTLEAGSEGGRVERVVGVDAVAQALVVLLLDQELVVRLVDGGQVAVLDGEQVVLDLCGRR